MLSSNYRSHISRGLILLFVFSALQAVFMQPAAHASVTSVTNVLVVSESVYTSSTTEYTFSFEPTTDLSGGDTITIELPTGYSLGPEYIDGISSEGLSFDATPPIEGDLGETIVELVLGSESSIICGELVEIRMELVNPSTYGKNVFHIHTSKDPNPVPYEVAIIERSIPELKVTPSTRYNGQTPFLYTFEFTSMAPISAYSTEIILFFPPEVLAMATNTPNAITMEGSYNVYSYAINNDSGTITFTSPMNIPSLTPVDITISGGMGLTNPSTPGYGSFSIKTTGDQYSTSDNLVYFHSSEGPKLGNVDLQEVNEVTSYLQLEFTNHLDLDQSDYVQIHFPYGFNVDPSPFETHASIHIGESAAVSTTANLTYSSLTISIPEFIKADTSSTIIIPIIESLTAGTHGVMINSSNESNQSTVQLIIEEKKVLYLGGIPTPPHVGVHSALTINFATNRQLIADQSSIIVEFPSEVTLPNEIIAGEITMNGEAVQYVDNSNAHTLTLTVPNNVNKLADVQIVFPQSLGIINPFVTGQYSFNVKVDDGNYNLFKPFTVVYSQAPSGGGDTSAPPSISPTNVRLVDYDGVAGMITGFVDWEGPLDQTGIESYSVFFLNSSGDIVSEFGDLPVNQERNYFINVKDTPIPAGATRIGVRWNSVESEGNMVTIALWDDPLHYPLELRFEDTDLSAGAINGILTWNKPPSESGIREYRISYRPTGSEEVEIGLVSANGSATYTYAIPTEIAMNQVVLYLDMVSEHGEMGGLQQVVTIMDYTSASTIPSSTVRADLSPPVSMFYFDDNKEIGNQVGYLYWDNPIEVSDITGYQLSYVMGNGTTQAFAHVKKKSYEQYQIYLSSISDGPSGVITGVQSISIRSTDSEGNVSLPVVVDIIDQALGNYEVNEIQFYDFDMSVGELAGTISWVHPQSVSLLHGYEIYFINDHQRRISKIGAVTISANQFIIPPNTVIPSGATGIAIFSKGNVLLSGHVWIELVDSDVDTNYDSLYRSLLTSVMDVNKDGLEIDDVVKYLATQYDMNGDNAFDADDVHWMLGLLIPLQES
jgi:hypothetical protein